ncbi:MAG: hypothetical protein Q8S00_11200 [Deltaproteobacteria bacterium]|nr:hypothetical protein [Deltaproteobacteria bacterium]MDZ4347099.1 hypothetical protein [Candidatus Binatia bacterium]
MATSQSARVVSIAVGLTAGAMLAWGCGSMKMAKMDEAAGMAELPRQTGDMKLPVNSPLQIASARKNPSTIASTVAFQLAAVPNPAKLEMLVTGIESACPLHGQPQGATELLVNGHQVTSLTLGPSGIGRTYRVTADLAPSVLKAGDNTLVLKGAPCTLGNFEVVKISDVIVRSAR